LITPFGELPDSLIVGMSLAEQHEWLSRPRSRRSALQIAAAAGLAGFAPLPKMGQLSAAASPLIGRQIVFGADPTSQVTIAFALKASFGTASVRVVQDSKNTPIEVTPDVHGVAGTSTRYVRAEFHGLVSGTRYRYVLTLDAREIGAGFFTTATAGAHKFRFTAFGDQSTEPAALSVLKQIANLGPSLHLFAGDLSYADATGLGGPGDILRPGIWDRWVAQNDSVASRIPWMCAPGNHEMEPGFALHGYAGMLGRVPIGGSSPLEAPVASKFQVGSVGFVGLDTNDVSYEIPANRGWTQGRQTSWLRQTLAEMRALNAGVDFIVVFMHASPYTSNSDHACDAGIREAWVPLFDKYHVDLVISGHNHCYERTLPIRGGAPTAQKADYLDSTRGTTYVTAGGGGASTSNYRFLPGGTVRVRDGSGYHREPASWTIPSDRKNSYNLLSVDVVPAIKVGDQTILRAVAFDDLGRELDRFSLVRPATVVAATSTAATSKGDGVMPWILGGGGGVLTLGVVTVGALIIKSRRSRKPRELSPSTSKSATTGNQSIEKCEPAVRIETPAVCDPSRDAPSPPATDALPIWTDPVTE
jgi:hypothetical protein